MSMVGFVHRSLWWADHLALGYFLILNSFYAFLLILSIPELWTNWRLADDEHLQRLLSSDALRAAQPAGSRAQRSRCRSRRACCRFSRSSIRVSK